MTTFSAIQKLGACIEAEADRVAAHADARFEDGDEETACRLRGKVEGLRKAARLVFAAAKD